MYSLTVFVHSKYIKKVLEQQKQQKWQLLPSNIEEDQPEHNDMPFPKKCKGTPVQSPSTLIGVSSNEHVKQVVDITPQTDDIQKKKGNQGKVAKEEGSKVGNYKQVPSAQPIKESVERQGPQIKIR